MSFDPNAPQTQQPFEPPMGHAAPRKSSKKWWILGGLGCFTLLLLCFGGIGGIGYMGYQAAFNNPAYVQAVDTIESSPEVAEALGSPVVVGMPSKVDSNQEGEYISMDYTVDVTGSNGTGEAHISVKGKPMTEDWETNKLEVVVGGQTIELNAPAPLNLDIDMGE